MKKATILLVILFISVIFAAPTYAAPPSPPEIEIKNDKGTSIAVDIGEPTVHIGSIPVEPEPITIEDQFSFGPENEGVSDFLYTVPPDYNLVIEFISVGIEILATGQKVKEFYILKQTESEERYYTPPLDEVYDDGDQVYIRGSQKILIHAEAGVSLYANFYRGPQPYDGAVYSRIVMTGYLIPINTAP